MNRLLQVLVALPAVLFIVTGLRRLAAPSCHTPFAIPVLEAV